MGVVSLFATQELSPQGMKLAQKGARIAKVMCSNLPQAGSSVEETLRTLTQSHACGSLSLKQRQAVAYFMMHQPTLHTHHHLHVPKEAKCPVCGMFVHKYPKWAAMIVVGQKRYYFDGVKDMMKYYIFDGDFLYDRKAIQSIVVSDYYTLEQVNAKEAFFVLDPDVYGPMGRELVAFASKEKAQTFLKEHHGKKLVRFEEITDRMVMQLDQ